VYEVVNQTAAVASKQKLLMLKKLIVQYLSPLPPDMQELQSNDIQDQLVLRVSSLAFSKLVPAVEPCYYRNFQSYQTLRLCGGPCQGFAACYRNGAQAQI
jgi:hypothetical protein